MQIDPDVIAMQLQGLCSEHGKDKCKFKDNCLARLKLMIGDETLAVCMQHRNDQYESYTVRGHWWFRRLYACRVRVDPRTNKRGWKYDLRYQVEGIKICRTAFYVFYGYKPRNRHSCDYVRDIRQGKDEPIRRKHQKNFLQLSSTGCMNWIVKYIGRHTDTPPVTYGKMGRAVVPTSTVLRRYLLYKDDLSRRGLLSKVIAQYVEYDAFRKMWKRTKRVFLNGHWYEVEERSSKTKGYPKCDTCEGWHTAIMRSPTRKIREQMRAALERHWNEVRCTRRQYATNIEHSKHVVAGWRIQSIAMDACDQAKTRIPLSSSDAKKLKVLRLVRSAIERTNFGFDRLCRRWMHFNFDLLCQGWMQVREQSQFVVTRPIVEHTQFEADRFFYLASRHMFMP